MLFVTFGLLFGLGILLWCAALSVVQMLRGYRDVGYPWDPATLHVEEADNCAEPTGQRQHAA
jgi:hypothetical protein